MENLKRGQLVEYTGQRITHRTPSAYVEIPQGAVGHVLEPDPLDKDRTIVNLHPICYTFPNSLLRPT